MRIYSNSKMSQLGTFQYANVPISGQFRNKPDILLVRCPDRDILAHSVACDHLYFQPDINLTSVFRS